MSERSVYLWILLLAIAGCSGETASVETGARPSNIPSKMPDSRPSQPLGTAEERAKLVANRIEQAKEASAKKDYELAIDKLREAILTEPKNRAVIVELVKAYQAKSLAVAKTDLAEAYRSMVTASDYLRTLRDYYPEATSEEKELAAEVHFNEATQQAMSLRVEETTGALNDAIGAGFKDFDRIRNNPDWKKMLDEPLFQKAFPNIAKKD